MQTLQQRKELVLDAIRHSSDIAELLRIAKTVNIERLRRFLMDQFDVHDLDDINNQNAINSAYLRSQPYDEILSDDIRVHILSYLHYKELRRYQIICKQFQTDCKSTLKMPSIQFNAIYAHKSLQLMFHQDCVDKQDELKIGIYIEESTRNMANYADWNERLEGDARMVYELCNHSDFGGIELEFVDDEYQPVDSPMYETKPYDLHDDDNEANRLMFVVGSERYYAAAVMIVTCPHSSWRREQLIKHKRPPLDRENFSCI